MRSCVRRLCTSRPSNRSRPTSTRDAREPSVPVLVRRSEHREHSAKFLHGHQPWTAAPPHAPLPHQPEDSRLPCPNGQRRCRSLQIIAAMRAIPRHPFPSRVMKPTQPHWYFSQSCSPSRPDPGNAGRWSRDASPACDHRGPIVGTATQNLTLNLSAVESPR